MKIRGKLLILLLALGLLAAQCRPASAPQPHITIANPYARPAPAGGSGVVYLTLKNEGNDSDALLNVTSAAAAAAELHQTTIDANDMAKMSPLWRVDLPAGASVRLEPGGQHIMLVNLKHALKVGEKVEVVLNFEKSGSLTVEVGVQEGGQSAEQAMDHSEHDH